VETGDRKDPFVEEEDGDFGEVLDGNVKEGYNVEQLQLSAC